MEVCYKKNKTQMYKTKHTGGQRRTVINERYILIDGLWAQAPTLLTKFKCLSLYKLTLNEKVLRNIVWKDKDDLTYGYCEDNNPLHDCSCHFINGLNINPGGNKYCIEFELLNKITGMQAGILRHLFCDLTPYETRIYGPELILRCMDLLFYQDSSISKFMAEKVESYVGLYKRKWNSFAGGDKTFTNNALNIQKSLDIILLNGIKLNLFVFSDKERKNNELWLNDEIDFNHLSLCDNEKIKFLIKTQHPNIQERLNKQHLLRINDELNKITFNCIPEILISNKKIDISKLILYETRKLEEISLEENDEDERHELGVEVSLEAQASKTYNMLNDKYVDNNDIFDDIKSDSDDEDFKLPGEND